MYDATKEQLEARFQLINAIRELIIQEYADYVYEKDVALYQKQLQEAICSIRLRVEEARSMNSRFYAKILQPLRILPKLSEDPKDYEYLKPEEPVKPSYDEEFEKQEALKATSIQIKTTRNWDLRLAIVPPTVYTFDSDIEFAFDFAIRHYDTIKNRQSDLNNPVYSSHTLSTFVNGVLSIDLPSCSSIYGNAYDMQEIRNKMEFFDRVAQNVVPKLEEVGAETFPFISSLEMMTNKGKMRRD